MPAREHGVSSNGLPWLRVGDGPHLLIYFPGINDALADVHHWSHMSLYLLLSWTRQHTVIVISRRRGLPSGYTIADMTRDYAEAVAAMIETFRPPHGRAHIAGVSMGGFCALQFGHDYPQLTASLGLHSSAYRPHPETVSAAGEWQRLARDGHWQQLYRALNDLTFNGIHRVGFNLFGMLLSPWVQHPPDYPQDFSRSIDACCGFDLSGCLGMIDLPVQMIAGDRDRLFPVELLRECAAGLPDCRLDLITGAGHGVIIDHKFRFDSLFTRFLSETV